MPSFSTSTRFAICLLLGVVPASLLVTLAPAASAAARVNHCNAPPRPGANYKNCNLTGVDFGGADLMGANFKGATLTDATFGGADLSGATLTSVVSGGITGTPASLPSNWLVAEGYLVGPQANLASANLAGADIHGADLAKANLTNADLSGANLTTANLGTVVLTSANLGSAQLSGATLTNVVSGGISGTPASLPSNWLVVDGYLAGPQANLTGANLTNADLAGADLYKANLTGANLSSANLTYATVKGSTLQGTVLGTATLTGLVSGGIKGTPATLPTNWVVAGTLHYLVGPTANLTRADFYGADLAGTDLATTNLSEANLTYANLTGANMSGADLSGVIWSFTTCPDGTSSNNDGDTCINNLGPPPHE